MFHLDPTRSADLSARTRGSRQCEAATFRARELNVARKDGLSSVHPLTARIARQKPIDVTLAPYRSGSWSTTEICRGCRSPSRRCCGGDRSARQARQESPYRSDEREPREGRGAFKGRLAAKWSRLSRTRTGGVRTHGLGWRSGARCGRAVGTRRSQSDRAP
jgi:hypothetical protein